MKTTAGVQRLNIVMDCGQGASPLVLWRIIRTDVRGDEFYDSFRSNYELGRPPRRIEDSAAVIHMGISTFLSETQAAQTASKFKRLGGFLGRLELRSGHGFNYAHTGFRGHITVWGDPLKLGAAVVDTIPVER